MTRFGHARFNRGLSVHCEQNHQTAAVPGHWGDGLDHYGVSCPADDPSDSGTLHSAAIHPPQTDVCGAARSYLPVVGVVTQHLLLMGPPGAGKGTQAALLAAWVPGAVHLEIGHLMRNAVRNDTPVGQRVKTYLRQGRLVPDPLVQAMVQQTLTTISSPLIIWDGFPRSLGQGQWLKKHLHQLQQQIVAVV